MQEISKKSVSKKKNKNNRSKKKSFQKIAKQNIDELFAIASELFDKNPKYANNCVRIARRTALRYKVSFDKEQKIQYCKRCGCYLFPSKTSRIRVSNGKIIVLCLNCKNISRYIYK